MKHLSKNSVDLLIKYGIAFFTSVIILQLFWLPQEFLIKLPLNMLTLPCLEEIFKLFSLLISVFILSSYLISYFYILLFSVTEFLCYIDLYKMLINYQVPFNFYFGRGIVCLFHLFTLLIMIFAYKLSKKTSDKTLKFLTIVYGFLTAYFLHLFWNFYVGRLLFILLENGVSTPHF